MKKPLPDNPKVSIVTAVFNGADYLPQALASVRQQAYPNIEHWIIDGGSTDGTVEILGQAGPSVRWISEPDRGQAHALNKGFARASGDIIGWLNADDSYQPQAIAQAIAALRRSPDVDAVYGHFNFIDEAGQVLLSHAVPPYQPSQLLYGNIVPNSGLFWRRRAHDGLGHRLVDEDLHYVMDWAFVLRLTAHYKVQRMPHIWSNFRMVRGTKSVEQTDRFWPEIIPVLADSLLPERDHALFLAHLWSAVEFARQGKPTQMAMAFAQATSYYQPSPSEMPTLAFALAETALRPWHQAFRQDRRAGQIVSLLSQSLAQAQSVPWAEPLAQALEPYRHFLVNGTHRPTSYAHSRFMAYTHLGDRLTLRLRSLKNRLRIGLSR